MGEASNKIDHNGNGAQRVVELRDEIARKREVISMELEELRRRRADAIVTAKKGAKFAGAGVVGLILAGSLMNAFADLFRSDEPEPTVLVEKESAEKQTLAAMLASVVVSMVVTEIRTTAMRYAKERLAEELERRRSAA